MPISIHINWRNLEFTSKVNNNNNNKLNNDLKTTWGFRSKDSRYLYPEVLYKNCAIWQTHKVLWHDNHIKKNLWDAFTTIICEIN